MKVEQQLKKSGINCEIIPTPIETKGQCGISIVIRDKSENEITNITESLKYIPITIKALK